MATKKVQGSVAGRLEALGISGSRLTTTQLSAETRVSPCTGRELPKQP